MKKKGREPLEMMTTTIRREKQRRRRKTKGGGGEREGEESKRNRAKRTRQTARLTKTLKYIEILFLHFQPFFSSLFPSLSFCRVLSFVFPFLSVFLSECRQPTLFQIFFQTEKQKERKERKKKELDRKKKRNKERLRMQKR